MASEEFWGLLDDYRCAILNGREPSWRKYAVAEQKLTGDAVTAAYDAQVERNEKLAARLRGKSAQMRARPRTLGKVMGELTEARYRIAELEAGLGHIIRWCEQDSDMLTFYQILISVVNMCHDTLGTKDNDEVDHPLAE